MLTPNTIIVGNALSVLKTFPSLSIDGVITSPPYWNLRDYNSEAQIWGGREGCEHAWMKWIKPSARGTMGRGSWDRPSRRANPTNEEMVSFECRKCKAWLGELGHEPLMTMYINNLMGIFNEVWRVLVDYGGVFVVIGDSYFGSGVNQKHKGKHEYMPSEDIGAVLAPNKGTLGDELFKKSLCGIPMRFAIAMIDSGWVLRNSIISHKINVIPQPDTTKFTPSYEFIYYFVKALKRPYYWFNEKAFEVVRKSPKGTNGREGIDWDWITFYSKTKKKEIAKKRSYWRGRQSYWEQQFEEVSDATLEMAAKGTELYVGGTKFQGFAKISGRPYEFCDVRNMRDVWSFPTASFKGSHFAVFNTKLIEIPMIASIPEKVCTRCGAPTQPVFEKVSLSRHELHKDHRHYRPNRYDGKYPDEGQKIQSVRFLEMAKCSCSAPLRRGIVLDMFFGAGTVGLVAKKNHRDFIGIELNSAYAEMARERTGLDPKDVIVFE